MGPFIFQFIRSYVPYLTLPVAAVIGVIGYNLENFISDKHTPTIESIKDQREKRLLEESHQDSSLKSKDFVPKTIFEQNVSPSLRGMSV